MPRGRAVAISQREGGDAYSGPRGSYSGPWGPLWTGPPTRQSEGGGVGSANEAGKANEEEPLPRKACPY